MIFLGVSKEVHNLVLVLWADKITGKIWVKWKRFILLTTFGRFKLWQLVCFEPLRLKLYTCFESPKTGKTHQLLKLGEALSYVVTNSIRKYSNILGSFILFYQLPKRYSKNLSRCDLNSDLYEGATSFLLVSDCSYWK